MKFILSKEVKFFSAVGIQLIIILAIVLTKLSVSAGGTEILLRIQPVDPRDLLRGDYATFSYSISSIDPRLFRGEQAVRKGETVYVVLEQARRERVWNVREVVIDKPKTAQVFLKGKVAGRRFQNRERPDTAIRIVYGIEEYFIPEGQGGRLAQWNPGDTAIARVMVDRHGNALIQGILVNNKPWP